jgi:8-oxo-dGTP pyrophosphatase MutT (NUDIX family)
MKKRPLFGLTVRALIENNDKILLSKEKKEGTWETPGGSVRLHETLEQALRREVLEETGYLSKIEKVFLMFIGGSKFVKNTKALCIIYKVKAIKKIKLPLPDIIGLKWFSKDEIRKLLKEKKVDWHDIKAFRTWVK